jgi:hypothetical protein
MPQPTSSILISRRRWWHFQRLARQADGHQQHVGQARLGLGLEIFKDDTSTITAAHNIIQDEADSGIVDGNNGNQVGVDPLLDPNGLQDNGGPTQTIALMPGSPAINAGDNALAVDADEIPLAFDQRGPGFPRFVGTVDIGAFEVQPRSVQIGVKPGSDPNVINLANKGVIAVAILSTEAFDALLVDASTVLFAGASAVHWAWEDVDGDGDLDLVLHFRTQDTNLAELYAQLLAEDLDEDGVLDSSRQTATVSLTGRTTADEYFAGYDDVELFLAGKNLRDLLNVLAAAGAI